MPVRTPKPQRHIDARNFVESRRTWQPDMAELEKTINRINAQLLRKSARKSPVVPLHAIPVRRRKAS